MPTLLLCVIYRFTDICFLNKTKTSNLGGMMGLEEKGELHCESKRSEFAVLRLPHLQAGALSIVIINAFFLQ